MSNKANVIVKPQREHKTQKALQTSEIRYRRLFESARDGILILDEATRKITDVNPFMIELLGYTKDEFVGRELWEIGLLNDEEASAAAFGELQENGYIRYDDLPLQSKSGKCHDVEFVSNVYEEAGHRVIQSNIRVITERKQAEELQARLTDELHHEHRRLDEILANVPGVVWETYGHPDEAAPQLNYVSPYVETMLGYSMGDWLTTPNFWLACMHPEDREGAVKMATQILASGKIGVSRFRWIAKDGQTLWVESHSTSARDATGKVFGMRGVTMDISERKRAEDQLDRFFTLSLDLLCIAGLDGHFKRVNPAFVETLGFTEAELLAKPFIERVHPEDRAATLAVVDDVTRGNRVAGFNNRYATKDGSWRWLEWRAVAALEEGLLYAVARDITERKEAEAALLGMRDQLEVRVQERTAELAQANEALLVQIAERERAETETRHRVNQQEAVAELGRRALSDADMDVLLKDATTLISSTLDVELSTILQLMPGGDTLRIRAYTGWNKDVSGERIAADSSSQAGYVLKSNTPTIVADLREETRFKASPLLLEFGVVSCVTVIIGGYQGPFGTLGANTLRRRFFTQDDVHFLESIANVLAASLERNRIETEIRLLNAQLKETNEKLHLENEDRQSALLSLQEVTVGLEYAKKEAEDAKEVAEIANRAKSEFLSRMSHELRTPMNAILGFGQLLDRSELAPRDTESVDHILKAGRHLLVLIDEVLDISRIEAGHMSLSLEPISVVDVVGEALNLVRPLAHQRKIQLINEIPAKMDWHVMADRQRLTQVMLNILSNAVKYNRESGKVTLSAEVRPFSVSAIEVALADTTAEPETESGEPLEATQIMLRLSIADTGPGLSTDEMTKLFVPFERLGAEQAGIEGTGIGLALSKQLVSLMDGNLGVNSTVGTGSVFWIELLLTTNPITIIAAADEPPPALALASGPQKTLLCIEDNLANLTLIKHILAPHPTITLLSAMRGAAGLELALQHQPDLILLDLHLPDISGEEVLRRLRSTAETSNIPVIVISADAIQKQIDRLTLAGATKYLTKPINVKMFLQVVREILNEDGEAKNA